MVDITQKYSSLRSATAEVVVRVSLPETIDAVRQDRVPKGNVMESARIAALFAVKRTSDVIPDCHPLPVESTRVLTELLDTSIRIEVQVSTVYKTGVEVEAMYGASVAAITVYDMLKPIDPSIVIEQIRLLSKRGGKSDYKYELEARTAFVLVCSDTISQGLAEDRSGELIIKELRKNGLEAVEKQVIPDDARQLEETVLAQVSKGTNLIVVCGGSGLSERDISTETLQPLLHRTLPGVSEAMRSFGQERNQRAMLSRSIAGTRERSLIISIPGSPSGAVESLRAVLPSLFHSFDILENASHTYRAA